MADLDARREALSTPEYRSGFGKVMTGNDADLTDAEREALRKGREVDGTEGPGYPMPVDLDPTWPKDAS